MRTYQLHTSLNRIQRPVRSSRLMPPLTGVAGWTIVALTTLLVPVSVYAWHDVNNQVPAGDSTEGSTNAPHSNGQQIGNAASNTNSSTTTPNAGLAPSSQLNASINSLGGSDGKSPQTTSHVSASVKGNTSSSVTINGETLNVPANNTISKTVISNSNNASLNITMHSSTDQSSYGSSSINVQMDSSSTEGGQQ